MSFLSSDGKSLRLYDSDWYNNSCIVQINSAISEARDAGAPCDDLNRLSQACITLKLYEFGGIPNFNDFFRNRMQRFCDTDAIDIMFLHYCYRRVGKKFKPCVLSTHFLTFSMVGAPHDDLDNPTLHALIAALIYFRTSSICLSVLVFKTSVLVISDSSTFS